MSEVESIYNEYLNKPVYLHLQGENKFTDLVGILSAIDDSHLIIKSRGSTYRVPMNEVRAIRRAVGEVEP